jgi:hypothetical protein
MLMAAAASVAVVVVALTPGFSTASSGSTTSLTSDTTTGHRMGGQPGQALSPREFRLTMERLFGQHAVFSVQLIQAPADIAAGSGNNEFAAAARDALQRNTRELGQAVAAMHGRRAGAQFAALWRRRVAALEEYGTARAVGNAAAATAAQQDMTRTASEYGQLVARLAGAGESSARQAAADLQARTRPLLEATDAHAAGQYPAASTRARAAYAALFRQGLAFTVETTPGHARRLTAESTSQATDLRSALGELFGEHAALAFDTSRAVVSDSPAAPASADALNANTAAIVEAVRAALGPRAAPFSQAWAAHINALMQFAVAVAGDDDEAQSRARAALDQFPARLGGVFARVAGGPVGRTLEASLQMHDQQLLQQVTAFAAGDYESSVQLAFRGYDHMFGVARVLADALDGMAKAAAPRRGARTGAGGMAR